VGIAIGALAGVAGLVAHSTLDFSARIPAVGVLAATLLGLATVTLHTRLSPGREQLLSGTRTLALGWSRRAALGVLAALAVAVWTWTWIDTARTRMAEEALAGVPPAAGLLHPRSGSARSARGGCGGGPRCCRR
jgi:hypothetical protein